jgi:hypothetical protein
MDGASAPALNAGRLLIDTRERVLFAGDRLVDDLLFRFQPTIRFLSGLLQLQQTIAHLSVTGTSSSSFR